MQITATKAYKGSGETEIFVTTSRCRYQVWFVEGIISLRGPGVDETADIEEERFDTLEAYALYIVLLFENGMWP